MAQIVRSDNSKKSSAKQPSTVCSIGTNDRLRSSIEQFNRSFVGKRVLKTSFVLSGESKRDYRKVFTNLLRHTYHAGTVENPWVKDPNLDLLMPRRIQDKNHTVTYNGVPISTDEIQLEPDGEVVDQVREFKSPYSLQFMEDLSWNLNRRKCLPYGLVVSQQNHFTLNDPYNLSPVTMGFNVEGGQANPVPIYGNPAVGMGMGFVKTGVVDAENTVTQLESDKLVSEPLLTDVLHNFTLGQSQMRTLCAYLNDRHFKQYNGADDNTAIAARWQPKHAIGKYHAQIQSGAAYYTFVNTSDSDMIVDMVVHKIKEGMAVTETTDTLTKRILEHYGENWMDKRIRSANNDLMNDFQGIGKFRPDDIYLNPKVKFLPASLRLNHRNSVKAIKAGQNVLAKYRHGAELGDADGTPAEKELAAVDSFNPEGKWGQEFQTRLQDFSSPPFVDVYRQQIVVLAGKRKTLTLRLPSKSYDPTQAVYSIGQNNENELAAVMNEHGYHVTFGVTGKKARTVIEPQDGVNPEVVKMGSKVVGVHHAPTSFKVIGRYYESIIPAVCVLPDNYTEQSLDIEPDIAEFRDDPKMYSALFNDVTTRDHDGRYIRLGVDGGSTKATQSKLIAKFKDWHEQALRSSRADQQLDESAMTSPSSMNQTSLGEDIKEEIDNDVAMTPERKPQQKKLKYETVFGGLDKLRRKIATFMSSVPDYIEEAYAWRDGHEHTIQLMKSGLLAILSWYSGDPKLAAMAAEAAMHSGISKAELIEARAEIADSSLVGNAIFSFDHYDNVKLLTVDSKRRKIMATDDIVIIDHDGNAEGVNPAPTPAIQLTTTGTAGSLVWLPTGSEKLKNLGLNSTQFQASLQEAIGHLLVSYTPTMGITDSYGVPNYIQNDDGTYRLQRFELKLSSSSTYSDTAVLVHNSSVPEIYVDEAWFSSQSGQYNGTAILGPSDNVYLVRGLDWDVL